MLDMEGRDNTYISGSLERVMRAGTTLWATRVSFTPFTNSWLVSTGGDSQVVHGKQTVCHGKKRGTTKRKRENTKAKPKLEAKRILLLECLPRHRRLRRKESLNCLAVHKEACHHLDGSLFFRSKTILNFHLQLKCNEKFLFLVLLRQGLTM